jgi:hypothetical protein
MCRCTGYVCRATVLLSYVFAKILSYVFRTKFFLWLVQYSGYDVDYVFRCLSRRHIFVHMYMRVFPKIAFLQILPFSALYPGVVAICLRCLTTLFGQCACFDWLFLFQCLYGDGTAVRVDSARDWELDGAEAFVAVLQPGACGRRLARG